MYQCLEPQTPNGNKYCYETKTPPPKDRDQCAVTTDCPKNWSCTALGGRRGTLKNCVRGTVVKPAKCKCTTIDLLCEVSRPAECLSMIDWEWAEDNRGGIWN